MTQLSVVARPVPWSLEEEMDGAMEPVTMELK